jgi:hypothetical protein
MRATETAPATSISSGDDTPANAHTVAQIRLQPPATTAMSMSTSQSFFEPPPSDSDDDEVNSLPSSATGSSVDDDEYVSDAEREWRESLQQIELLLTMVLVPYVGKYFGRKAAYWGECIE